MADSYSVKGSVLQSKLDALEAIKGRQEVVALTQRVGNQLPHRLNPLDWYPFDLLVEVLDDIRVHSFDGRAEELARIGVETAKLLLSSTYRPLTHAADWKTFMSTAARLHSQYYSAGQMITSFDGTVCRVDLTGAPRYALVDLHVAGGFYTGSASHYGHQASYEARIVRDAGCIEVNLS